MSGESEIMASLRLPETTSWQTIKRSGLPVVLYGMGNGADRILDELYRLGIPVAGVTASDDFVRGQIFRGFEVKKLGEFSGDFILCLAFGSGRPEVIEHITDLGKRYRLVAPSVPVCGDEIFNMDFALKNYDSLNEAYSLFSGESARVYEMCVNFLLTGDLNVLFAATSPASEKFSVLNLSENEVYADIGAYNGDTVREFLNAVNGKYSRIIAVEPNPKSYLKLCASCASLENFVAYNAAVSSDRGKIVSFGGRGRGASVGGSGSEAECVSLDDLLKDEEVTYLKADVEGEEIPMLTGAAKTLSEKKPKLNIALYHKSRDIFEIPLLVKKLNPDYKLEIRRHPHVPCWDMNLYAL